MKIKEMVEHAVKSNPSIKPGVARLIITELLDSLGKELAKTKEGRYSVPNLGTFIVRNPEKEVDGKKVKARKVLFNEKSNTNQVPAKK